MPRTLEVSPVAITWICSPWADLNWSAPPPVVVRVIPAAARAELPATWLSRSVIAVPTVVEVLLSDSVTGVDRPAPEIWNETLVGLTTLVAAD